MVNTKQRTCDRCGSRALASIHGELKCLMCGLEPKVELVPSADGRLPVTLAARRCEVAVRTVRRWIDAGVVDGDSPTGSGRVRLVDVVSLAAYAHDRRTAHRTCEKCGGDIAPSGVRRGSRVNRRWCDGECKSAHHHAARDRSRSAA